MHLKINEIESIGFVYLVNLWVALLSLFLSSKHPEIERLFLFSPAMKIDGLWESLFAWPFIRIFTKKIQTIPCYGKDIM